MNLLHPTSQSQDVVSIPATELAAFDARSLFQLKTLASGRLATAKAEVDHIEHALSLKYAERAKHLRAVMERMEDLMGRTIAAGQRLIEDAHYAGADFGGNGCAFAMSQFRDAIEDAFSGPLETVRLSMEDAR